MSLAELLPAIRALPAGEKVQLMHLLVDELGGAKPVHEEFPEHLRHLIPPPGTVFEVWFPEANPQAVAAAMQALQDRKGV
jgi:hypothetical protein